MTARCMVKLELLIDMKVDEFLVDKKRSASRGGWDSHDLILAVAKWHQQEYIEGLFWAAQARRNAPFQHLHGLMGKRIKKVMEAKGYVGKPHGSKDIFGQDEPCVKWV